MLAANDFGNKVDNNFNNELRLCGRTGGNVGTLRGIPISIYVGLNSSSANIQHMFTKHRQ